MQQVRLWEITADRKLLEIPARHSGLEQWLEDWLVTDISAVDPGLMVIGRQVVTRFGGVMDLLCIDRNGDLVVVELKSGRTPRDVTAQALDYCSWVQDCRTWISTGSKESPIPIWVVQKRWSRLSGRGLRRSCRSSSTRDIALW